MNLCLLSKIKNTFRNKTYEVKIIVNNNLIGQMKCDKHSLSVLIGGIAMILVSGVMVAKYGQINDDVTVAKIRKVLDERSYIRQPHQFKQ